MPRRTIQTENSPDGRRSERVEEIDQLLEIKTRLTTIRGYAQLLERDIDRAEPQSERMASHVGELNHEIVRLIELIGSIEASMTDTRRFDA
jgi:signal transduction histidine kinase